MRYAIDREAGTVTVWEEGRRSGFAVALDESDLITLLSDLQAGQADLNDVAGQ